MQQHDKRLVPRISVGETPMGSLSMLYQGRKLVIRRLMNISESGLSCFVDEPVDISERIGIAYADAHVNVNVEVFGRVAWCSQIQHADTPGESATSRYLVGVELFSPMMLYAVLPKG